MLAALQDETAAHRSALIGQIEQLDLEQVRRLKALLSEPERPAADGFEPPEVFPLRRSPAQAAEAQKAIAVGEQLLGSGKVGFLLVAGGQGSRLGFDGPKGMFPAGPVSGISLFAWHAARIAAARRRYGARFPWFIMTSRTNDGATRDYFEQQRWFGLGQETVHFFCQDMLPALDSEGGMIRSAPGELFLAPNGHGGTLLALARSGMLAIARGLGVEQFSYFQVDNPLVRPADPLFLGLHALAGAEMSSKVVAKRDPGEKVGVLGRVAGRLACIEYSDLPQELREARTTEDSLLFSAGNIAVHVLRRDFIEGLTAGGQLDLPWHLARKRMPAISRTGAAIQVDGVKFETFIFDALARTKSSVVLEVDRGREFSPIKNHSGGDSPASCRADMTALFGSFLEAAGQELPRDATGAILPIEIDPRIAEDLETFLERRPLGQLLPNGLLFR